MATKRTPKVGEPVIVDGKRYIVTRVSPDGSQVDLTIAGTEFERFRIPTSKLSYPKK
jgi:hypothetical protein